MENSLPISMAAHHSWLPRQKRAQTNHPSAPSRKRGVGNMRPGLMVVQFDYRFQGLMDNTRAN